MLCLHMSYIYTLSKVFFAYAAARTLLMLCPFAAVREQWWSVMYKSLHDVCEAIKSKHVVTSCHCHRRIMLIDTKM